MLCYEIDTFSSKFPTISEDMLDNIRLFQNLLNSIVLHEYKMTIIYELLMSRELSNQVKAHYTIWFSHFLIIQYDDSKWIEHFKIIEVSMR
jgi:hypothetical protein